jgi:hypothetical protein
VKPGDAVFERRVQEEMRALDRRIRERARGRIPIGPDNEGGRIYAPAGSSQETITAALRLYVQWMESRGAEKNEAAAALTRLGCTYSPRGPK